MKNFKDTEAVILAAGFSSRMKSQKAFLIFEDDKTFLERTVEVYMNSGIENITVVVNPAIENRTKKVFSKNNYTKHVKILINRFVERGRFYSIKQSLEIVSSHFCFLQNIDNPFITPGLIRKMKEIAEDESYVVPLFEKREGHPILLSREIVRHLHSLKGNDHNLRTELKKFKKINLKRNDDSILININCYEDYQKHFLSNKSYLQETL